MKQGIYALWAFLILIVAGCGGGGSGTGGGAARVNFFATDDLSAGYRSVWVTIYKVDLRKSDNSTTTIFSDPEGKEIDLRALNNGGNLYEMLGARSIATGTYTGMSFELDRNASLIQTGSSASMDVVFDDVYGASRTKLDFAFSSPVTLVAGDNNLIADFDLSQWTLVGNEITNAVIVQGTGAGFESAPNHRVSRFRGRIESLSGQSPNLSFSLILNSENSYKVAVVTNSSTAIYNQNGQPNPTLSNGARVKVFGKFDASTNTLVATTIMIRNNGNPSEFEARGDVSSANSSTRSFVVVVRGCRGFLPNGTSLNVQVDNSTRFFGFHGAVLTEAAFFAAIGGESKEFEVEVEGMTYNSGTNTLLATKCKLEDHDGNEGEVEARGAPSALDVNAGTFNIALTSWEGFSATNGQVIGVTTSGETEFKDGNNQPVTKAEFFVLLALAPSVKVEGRFVNGSIVAEECSLRINSGGGGGEDPHEAEGSPTNINVGARTFTLVLLSWSGFNGSVGLQVAVEMTANATYRDDGGKSISQAAFFEMMDDGWLVEVEGTYAGGVFTGVKAKLDDD